MKSNAKHLFQNQMKNENFSSSKSIFNPLSHFIQNLVNAIKMLGVTFAAFSIRNHWKKKHKNNGDEK